MNSSIDVCISFDTTGSMYPCLTQVRRSIKQIVSKLFSDIPSLRISIIAHGDYCDAEKPYVIKLKDFSSDEKEIIDFITTVEPTYGGDAPECYELVLNKARTSLSWKSGTSKVLVIIGDDVPHGPNYAANVNKIDWRNELGLLLESGINVYGIHAMPGVRKHSKPFYEEIANKTGGFYLTLDQFANIPDLIMAICYKQDGEDSLMSFAEELKSKGRMNYNIRSSIQKLSYREIEEYVSEDGLNPVPDGRFQVLTVDKEQSIKEFILEQGISFKVGRGFYELTKTEKVGVNKEVLLYEKETGKIFNGEQVRDMLKLSPQQNIRGVLETLKPVLMDKYKVFIQSTSYNRKLMANTSLLYEVEDWDR
ncbi:VWA domain-containing protein [Clostridium sp. C8-1-8]|uniref:vWA domain-containing protein n=1 Tax=Clostridium sp. C8-1-8 TaxID=2698831 RepID=UPI00136C93AF|nr:VWA domain-containing protein [Clostridium sp. C8-1-8]